MEKAVFYMDDEIREELHAEMIGASEDFYNEYCKRHLAVHGEDFEEVIESL